MVDISIIVPIFNTSKYLDKCISSLINQTKKELEFILINDGSLDDSEDIIKKYDDDRIKYYKNTNQGIGKTRNFGIDKASGKYLMFLDSDDYLELNACEEFYNKAELEQSDIVVCDFYKVFANQKVDEVIIDDFKTDSLNNNPKLLNIINLGPCNKIYKSELIKKNSIKFIENLKYEDAPFVAFAIDKANNISKVNKFLTNYVIHDNSETTVRDDRVFDIIKIVDIIRKYFVNNESIREELDILTISILMNYNIQQRAQINSDTLDKFIDESFLYLEKNVPNYKKSSYYKNRNFFKTFIEKNKSITKLYCKVYRKIK